MRPMILPITVTALFLLACSGGATETETDGDATEQEEGDEEAGGEEASAEDKLQGTWAFMPGDAAKRRYKIMQAACSGKPKQKQKLGELSDSEKSTFDYYKGRDKSTKEGLLKLIENLKTTRYKFDNGTVTWSFGDSFSLDKEYTIEEEDPLHVKLESGSTVQHWYITWKGDDAATVDVQYEGSTIKMEHKIKRK